MQNWQKEFREHFDQPLWVKMISHLGWSELDVRNDLEAFITQLLAERDAEWREAVALERGERTTGCLMKKDCDCGEVFFIQGRNATIDELNERISKL